MTCDEIRAMIGPWLDGELEPADARAVERHVTTCEACAREMADLRALSGAIRDEMPSLAAPDALRTRIAATTEVLAADAPPVSQPAAGVDTFVIGRRPPRMAPQWLAAAALFVVVGVAAWMLGVVYGRAPGNGAELAMRDAVVASHVRSLEASHLIDVTSSDRHTVKPWFDGKLDFSPPVPDLTAQGFPLIGGRLDYLDNRPVAALVYGRAKHDINLFIWPAPPESSPDAAPSTVRGYHVRHWVRDGMTFWAVSDVAEPDLATFVSLFQGSTQPAESVR
jgi:anti-sigma factor RsiW